MTKESGWLEKIIRQYLNDAFLVHELDLNAQRRGNRFIRWWLEQVRNLLAVSAFYFLAEKANDSLLKILSWITIFLFASYFTTWQNTFSFRFLPYIKNPRANFWVNIALWLCVIIVVLLVVMVLMAEIIRGFEKLVP